MSVVSRSRWTLAVACVAVPATVLLTACGSDSTSPKASVASADTVAVNQSTAISIEHWVNPGSDSGYLSEPVDEEGNYIESYSNGNYWYQYRTLVPFPLPTLAGRGVVDSAKVYQFVCETSGPFSDSVVVDHVNWGAAYQDSASFAGQTLQANLGTLTRSDSIGWKSVTVTSAVQADYAAKRATSQYRFEFQASTITSGENWLYFDGSDCDVNQPGAVGGDGYLVIWSH